MKQTLLYILPKRNFFAEGGRGRVSHALGVAEGFAEQDWQVTVASGDKLSSYRNDLPASSELLEVPSHPSKSWLGSFRTAVYERIEHKTHEITLVRYAASLPFYLIPLAKRIRKQGGLAVVEVNSFAYHNYANLPQLVRRLLFKFEAMVVSQFDIIYVVSQRLKDQLLESGVSTQIAVVPNGGSSNTLQASGHNASGKVRLKYFGVMQPYYDFTTLIKGFEALHQQHNDIELHFHGDGPVLGKLKEDCQNISGIQFYGRYNKNDVSKMVDATSDILLLPYEENEDTGIHSPIKLFEYMALGAPIVACHGGQIGDILQDQKNGILFAPGDLDSLTKGINTLMVKAELRTSLGFAARQSFLQQHTWTMRAKQLIGVCESRASGLAKPA